MNIHRHALLSLLGLTGLALNGIYASGLPRDLCPETCLEAGSNPSNWTVVAEFPQLQACKKPLVLDFLVNNNSTTYIRVCNVFINDFDSLAVSASTLPKADIRTKTEQVVPQLAWTPAASEAEIGGRLVVQSIGHLQSYLKHNGKNFGQILLFGTVSGTTAGVYVGANVLGSSVVSKLFDSFFNNIYSNGIADSKATLVQICKGRSSNDIFGLVAASSDDFSIVHNAVAQWTNGTCVDTSSYAETSELNATAITVINSEVTPIASTADGSINNPTEGQPPSVVSRSHILGHRYAHLDHRQSSGILNTRANCRTVIVDSGDSCGSLVKKCGGGATTTNFPKYNPKANLCSTLQPGQRVCCTAGELPDIRPKPNADGSCFAYKIKPGDFCNKIATSNGLTVMDLEGLNKETWGWNGCDHGFWPDNWLCLSKGTPPFPAPIANAVCGPQKPKTLKPAGSTSRNWAKLNPCAINACCNIWGQCGGTVDFCVDTNTGPPGTAKKDTFGCVSNCGMTIIQSSPPAKFIKLGYFEGFNLGRECLNMDASQIDPSFSHVHFAFGMISDKFEVYQENVHAEFQFQRFKKVKGPKRIISFGGWVFSAEAPNFPIFRNGVKAQNREKFATNLVKYVVDNGLDGLDIDWEYPSAPDLPGIPAGDVSEALDYLRLLVLIRSKMPKDKTLSIAAPASYWYLKQFPIKAMSEVLDYIVYMTYDLHGQWDAGNKWASPGCPTGNCLRSHVNRTETLNALTMITKAGVPSNKVLVGVSSYGRSFQMVDPSCTGPTCLFTGNGLTSFARKGRCTQTSGYIANAEIDEIRGRTWVDDSNSKIMVDGDLWVSYMDDSLKTSRTQLYQRYGMGGTTDWAVDLVKFRQPPDYSGSGGINSALDWRVVKFNIKVGLTSEQLGCEDARLKRTGDWVNKQCTMAEVASVYEFTSQERWKALDCHNGWKDAVRIWRTCDTGKNITFSASIANFLHTASNTDCDNLAAETNCDYTVSCSAHNSPNDENKYKTGACTYEIWNSITSLHRMVKNFHESLKDAGLNLGAKQNHFIETFAPKPDDGKALFGLFLTLLPVPLNTGAARFFASAFTTKKIGNSETWEAATSNLVSATSSIAKDALNSETDDRSEIAFNVLIDTLLTSWRSQIDTLMKKLFGVDMEDTTIELLESIISDGSMINGYPSTSGPGGGEHTKSWNQEKNIERIFYAAAIPAAWAANRPAPVVIDFGASCEIDARKYFREEPSKYNIGWKCLNGHSYMLAGVRDGPQGLCGEPAPGGSGCTPTHKWTLNILQGIDQLQDVNEWHNVTVIELITGAVNTFIKNGLKNDMRPGVGIPNPLDKTIQQQYDAARIDITTGGLIRIPVCGAEEAKANLAMGREQYGDSQNYPCNP